MLVLLGALFTLWACEKEECTCDSADRPRVEKNQSADGDTGDTTSGESGSADGAEQPGGGESGESEEGNDVQDDWGALKLSELEGRWKATSLDGFPPNGWFWSWLPPVWEGVPGIGLEGPYMEFTSDYWFSDCRVENGKWTPATPEPKHAYALESGYIAWDRTEFIEVNVWKSLEEQKRIREANPGLATWKLRELMMYTPHSYQMHIVEYRRIAIVDGKLRIGQDRSCIERGLAFWEKEHRKAVRSWWGSTNEVDEKSACLRYLDSLPAYRQKRMEEILKHQAPAHGLKPYKEYTRWDGKPAGE